MSQPHDFSASAARTHFPALSATSQIYMDNAGGSQVLGSVIASITTYLTHHNVQLGATYPIGQTSTQKYTAGYAAAARYVNASPEEIVLGASTTQLFRNLSVAFAFDGPEGKRSEVEIVVSKLDHEANIASWVSLAEQRGFKLVWWSAPPSSNPHLTAESLTPLLNERTGLVTCTHTSNILGSITDIKAIADAVHDTHPEAGTLLCVDGVAYAPHRPLDLKALGVDCYAFSWYKVYGPHVAQLYVSEKAQKSVRSLGHYFKSGENLEEKLGLAGGSYELVASIPTVVEYLEGEGVWDGIVRQEVEVSEVLLKYLRDRQGVTIYGERSSDIEKRVPVISFTVEGWENDEVVSRILEESGGKFGFRAGHMYSKRLCNEVLGLEGESGAIRVSLLHYNTMEEVEGFVKCLDKVLASRKGPEELVNGDRQGS